jgi:hypothetical protein
MINLIPNEIRINNRFALRNVKLIRYTGVALLTMAVIVAITGLSILNMSRTENNLAGSSASSATSTNSSGLKPFIIQASVKDRTVASTLLENIKTSNSIFTDADIVSVNQSTKGTSTDANALPSIGSKYPYDVTINAYLKKIDPSKASTTNQAANKP